MKRLRCGKTMLVRRFHRSQKGFTLMELLIVVAVLGILAAVLVPRMGAFLLSGRLAAANNEVASCESAALAYYADHSEEPPETNDALYNGGYVSDTAKHADYTFDTDCRVNITDATVSDVDENIIWDTGTHKWIKKPSA